MLEELGLRPLSARSLVLSTLLGSHPPRLPARHLVALGEEFDIAEGTMRTAVSRMLAAGELQSAGGSYELDGRLRERQSVQDEGMVIPDEPWDGSWWVATVTVPRRTMADRRAFRTHMITHRMAELRPDTWMRPANVGRPVHLEDVLIVRGSMEPSDAERLVPMLWDLEALASTAKGLLQRADTAGRWMDAPGSAALRDTFLVCIAIVRFLRIEPQLPTAIVGADWPSNLLRAAYDALLRRYNDALASFLRTVPDG